MGIFDNVTSVTINDKEVASIEVDGGVIYTKSSGEDYGIVFNVLDSQGEPVEGVKFTIGSVTHTTDNTGSCTFSNLESYVEYTYTIEYNDYYAIYDHTAYADNPYYTVSEEVTPIGHYITIKNGSSGVANTEIYLGDVTSPYIATTDSHGNARLGVEENNPIHQGSYTVSLRYEGIDYVSNNPIDLTVQKGLNYTETELDLSTDFSIKPEPQE